MTRISATAPRISQVKDRPRLTWWSLATAALAVPVWWFVIASGVMSRAIDGGIFLSVIGGLQDGLPLYSGVWDNKDPLFYGVMLAAASVVDAAPFLLDWLWVPVASLGAWLIARPLMSADRALLVGLVAAPFVMTGPFYVAGWTNTPGTALALLSLGLLSCRRAVAAGVVIGLLAFTKLLVWPVGVASLLVLLVFPSRRRDAARGLVTLAGTVAIGMALLAVVGWLGGYVDALQRNRAYSSDVTVYFGFEDSPWGHLTKLAGDWSTGSWVAVAAVVLVAVVTAVLLAVRATWRTSERVLLAAWLWIAILGTLGVLGLTYVWPHHAQFAYLPTVLAVVALTAIIPERWPYLVAVALVVVGTWLMTGTGSPSTWLDRHAAARDSFAARWDEIREVPTDARLLLTVPGSEFTYARLGSNDDRGYLYDAPPSARLSCAQFHLYDFSPPADFERMLECIQDVDVVVMTDSFVVFGNGGRAASVQPILQYVDYAFTCLRVDDRQVCTRKPGL